MRVVSYRFAHTRDVWCWEEGTSVEGGLKAGAAVHAKALWWNDTGGYQVLEGGALVMSCGSEQREPGATAHFMDTRKLSFQASNAPQR